MAQESRPVPAVQIDVFFPLFVVHPAATPPGDIKRTVNRAIQPGGRTDAPRQYGPGSPVEGIGTVHGAGLLLQKWCG